jgi:DNA-binding NarL/FixJ family response regulator
VNLSNRETEVLTLIAKGMNRGDIARLLGISSNTAAGYIKTIYQKLNIASRAEATLEAARLGLVQPSGKT